MVGEGKLSPSVLEASLDALTVFLSAFLVHPSLLALCLMQLEVVLMEAGVGDWRIWAEMSWADTPVE